MTPTWLEARTLTDIPGFCRYVECTAAILLRLQRSPPNAEVLEEIPDLLEEWTELLEILPIAPADRLRGCSMAKYCLQQYSRAPAYTAREFRLVAVRIRNSVRVSTSGASLRTVTPLRGVPYSEQIASDHMQPV